MPAESAGLSAAMFGSSFVEDHPVRSKMMNAVLFCNDLMFAVIVCKK
jgi:hypothetical protein